MGETSLLAGDHLHHLRNTSAETFNLLDLPVVCHALHVAVHTEPHVTPAAYPLAVQFNQADDMQHDIPRRSVPLTASLGGLDRGDV